MHRRSSSAHHAIAGATLAVCSVAASGGRATRTLWVAAPVALRDSATDQAVRSREARPETFAHAHRTLALALFPIYLGINSLYFTG
jgi:hypothetical protein